VAYITLSSGTIITEVTVVDRISLLRFVWSSFLDRFVMLIGPFISNVAWTDTIVFTFFVLG
jgi:hypothetical protein